MHFYRGEFAEAGEIHRRLLSLNSTNPDVLGQVGLRTARAGNWDERIALVRRSIDRSITEPWGYHTAIALHHYRRGDYDAALAEAEPLPVPFIVTAIHGQLGNKAEAQRALDRAMELNPRFMRDPWTALGRSNIPEEVIDELVDGLAKVGLGTFPAIN